MVPDYPTVTVYNHIDVQPAERSEWATDPFRMVIKKDRYYGRGAADDKGPALSALMAVVFAREHNLPLNFQFVWEFEEEIGSPHFEDFMKAKHRDLATGSIVIGDGGWVAPGKPALPTGLRGMMAFEVSLQTAGRDVHSGLAGGAARNPLGELAQIVTECYDETSGRVKIPGFYDQAVPPTAAEKQHFLDSGFSVKQFIADHELAGIRTTDTADVLDRSWPARPLKSTGSPAATPARASKPLFPARPRSNSVAG